MKASAPVWPRSVVAADDSLTWYRTTVEGRPASYGVGGTSGPAVVFLHGWATGSRTYRRALRRLVRRVAGFTPRPCLRSGERPTCRRPG